MFKTLPFRRLGRIKKLSDNLFARASEDVVCKVWCRKYSFAFFAILRKKNYGRKWAWHMPKDAADSSEYVRIRF